MFTLLVNKFTFNLVMLAIAMTLSSSFNTFAAEVVDVEPERASAVIAENPELVIIDVRTPPEFNEGHIQNAININGVAPDFERQLVNDERLKNRNWLIYCRTGNRSKEALPAVKRVARGVVYHLIGGTTAWIKAGYPLTK